MPPPRRIFPVTKATIKGLSAAAQPPAAGVRTLGLSWPLVMGVATFMLVILLPGALTDGDTYWHIAAGQWILSHFRVPTHDPFSFSMPGAPWTAHEWGAELLLAWVYRLWSWPGLMLLIATTTGLTIAYLTRFLSARLEPLHALMFTALALVMMLSHLLVRPHVLGWALTTLWVGTLLDASEANKPPPWGLLAVMILWANLHASFVIGLGMAGAIGAEAVLSAVPADRRRVAHAWLGFVAVSTVCSLANPQGYHAIVFSFDLMHLQPLLTMIQEWQQPDFQKAQGLTLWLLVILGLAFAGRVRLPLVRAALIMVLLCMALAHARNVALLGLLSILTMARPLASQWREQRPPGADVESLDRWFAAFTAPARSITICLMCLLAGAGAALAMHVDKPEPEQVITPRRALQALLATGAGSRILNSYHLGGYLIFRGIPVFIDGRADMYGDVFLDRYFKALTLNGTDSLEALLQQYRIDSTLLQPGTPAVALLDHLPGWQRIYADPIAVVHVRRHDVPAVLKRPSE
jgi:hypothetical protein